jgi:ABC-2 type transport system ATP-binding protein
VNLEALIEAHNLHKSFGETHAVDGLSLRVSSGEVYGLVGPDGAGKTTTMRLLCGALQPDRRSGSMPAAAGNAGALAETDRDVSTTIRVAGYDVTRQTEQARTHIGYLPQRFSLYEDLTVLENIRFFAEVRGLKATEWRPRCMEILRFVGLDVFTDRLAGQLSGGMKQKLGLAAALVHQPRLLLLDEPTTGVDPVTRQDFWQLIIRLVSRANHDQDEVAVLVSTPYMDEAARCTRVGFMRGGRLLLEGTPADLRTRLDERILELRGKPLSLLRRVSGDDQDVEDAQMFGDRIHLRTHPGKTAEVEARLRQHIPAEGGEITLLRPVPPQLEDVFISLLE